MSKVDKSTNQATNDSRRRFFATAGGAIGAVVIANALPQIARAEDLPHLTLDDPTAKALNYTEDNTKAGPPHQAGQDCSNCNFYTGGAPVMVRASCSRASRSTPRAGARATRRKPDPPASAVRAMARTARIGDCQ